MLRENLGNSLENKLKEAADYKYALEESCIVAITDQKGIIHYANDNFCSISKYAREELIGQDHRIINSGYHSKEFIRNLWQTIANGNIWRGEIRNRAKDNSYYWVDTTIVPFLNKDRKPYQYVAIRADITDRKNAEEKIVQGNRLLEKSLKEASDYKYALEESCIVAITDQKGVINYANDNFCNISKYTREELIGQDHRIINSDYHPKEFIRELWQTIANGNIWRGELKNKAKDGSYYWVDTTIVPFLNKDAKPYQYVAIRADISDRKNAEEKIIKGNRLYEFISHINQSIVHIKDEQELFEEACRIAINIGLYRSAWIGLLDENLLLKVLAIQGDPGLVKELSKFSGMNYKDAQYQNSTTAKVLSTGKHDAKNDVQNDPSMQAFSEMYKKFGVKASVSFPLRRFDKVIGVFGFHSGTENFIDEDEIKMLEEAANDISFALENFEKANKHQQAEAKVLQNEARLNEAQAMAHIGNWQIDFKDNSQLWSDELYNIFALNKDEVEPSPELFLSFMHPDDSEIAHKEVRRVMETAQPAAFNFRFIRKDGAIRHGHSKARFEYDEAGNPVRLYGIIADITDQKLAEEERERMIADMIQRNRDLEQFTFIVSHNLRAPTANIIGFTDNLLEETHKPDIQKELLNGLSVSVSKLDKIIKDLNNILQVKREVNDKREVVRFSELVNDIFLSIGNIIGEHNARIESDFKEVNEMFSLKVYLHSIFYNLISNSIKYSKPNVPPLIEINSRCENGKIVLVFKDNGLGIDVKTKGEQVFGLYKRFHSHVEGKGMGLFMVKTQVEALGGKISIESEPNRGTTFKVEFKKI